MPINIGAPNDYRLIEIFLVCQNYQNKMPALNFSKNAKPVLAFWASDENGLFLGGSNLTQVPALNCDHTRRGVKLIVEI